MTPLQRLIDEVRNSERGLSYAKLAKRSEKPDGSGGISRGRIQQLATQPVRRGLDAETREALARALRVPVTVVNDALSSSVGTFSERGESVEMRRLLASIAMLPVQRQQMWFEMARSLADIISAHSGELDREATGTHDHEIVPVQTGLPATVTALVDDVSARQDEIAAVVARVLREMAEERSQTGR